MRTVELIYDRDCPNVERARGRLRRALEDAGLPARWVEWEQGDPSSPAYARNYGSPTVLVDGKDVDGVEPSQEISCCRLYVDPNDGLERAPSAETIVAALRKSASTGSGGGRTSGWRSSLGVLPGIGASLLPVGFCPACWPAYAGLLGSLGLGFLFETAYLLPVTALFLAMAVAALGYRARARRGYGPLGLGLGATALILLGKFVWPSDPAAYTGAAMLVVASLWNAWPKPRLAADEAACPNCSPGKSDLTQIDEFNSRRRKR